MGGIFATAGVRSAMFMLVLANLIDSEAVITALTTCADAGSLSSYSEELAAWTAKASATLFLDSAV